MRLTAHHGLLLTALLSVAMGCGGASTTGPEAPTREEDAAIELSVIDAEGQMYFVGDLRGSPVLLFLFATFDGVCQAALQPLSRVTRKNPDLRVLAIAVQPNPRLLVDAYARALTPPFPVTFDPDDTISTGRSALGRIDTVPTFIALDRRGREVERRVGFASERQLTAMIEKARAAQPPAPRQREVPLLGNVE